VTNYTYDARGRRLTALTDPLGRTTSFGYDAYGNLSVITSPLGTTTSFVGSVQVGSTSRGWKLDTFALPR